MHAEETSEAVDIKDMIEVFEKLHTDPDENTSDILTSLPLDQQVLLLAVVQLIQQQNQKDQEDPALHQTLPRKRRTASAKKKDKDCLDLNTMYAK